MRILTMNDYILIGIVLLGILVSVIALIGFGFNLRVLWRDRARVGPAVKVKA
jgi:hypothetical protein